MDPALHLTASTHEFNFHLPLNTERVRPESSEHEYAIPTISAQRMTPSAPPGGGVSNLQRIFITSEQERAEVEDLSQISFVTDALSDVFMTDFNFADSTKDGGKGSKIKSARINSDNVDTKKSSDGADVERNARHNNEDAASSSGIVNTEEIDLQKAESSCDSSVVRLADGASAPVPGSSTKDQTVSHVDDEAEESDDIDYASLSTESETDDYKASQRGVAQAQDFAADNALNLESGNRSDDDKGALKLSNAAGADSNFDERERLTDKISMSETAEKAGSSGGQLQSTSPPSDPERDCDKQPGDSEADDSNPAEPEDPATSVCDPLVDVQPGPSDSQPSSRVQKLKYWEMNSSSRGSTPGANAVGVSDFDWDRER